MDREFIYKFIILCLKLTNMRPFKSLLVLFSFMAIAGIANSSTTSLKEPGPFTQENVQYLKVSYLVNLSAAQFGKLTGKKLNVWQRVKFDLLKIKMRHDLKKDPNLQLKDYYSKSGKKRLGTGWIILISVVGVLLILALFAAMVSTGWKSSP